MLYSLMYQNSLVLANVNEPEGVKGEHINGREEKEDKRKIERIQHVNQE